MPPQLQTGTPCPATPTQAGALVIAGGSGALVPAFNQFALAHHGVDVECAATSRYDYIADFNGDEEPMSEHHFARVGWDSPILKTEREEALEINDHRIIVFDPLGRVGPNFGDPSPAGGLTFLPLTLPGVLAATAIRLYLIDSGEIKDALTARCRRTSEPVTPARRRRRQSPASGGPIRLVVNGRSA